METQMQIAMADDLTRLGLRRGDAGGRSLAYWAHSGEWKIVATIMSPDLAAFWSQSAAARQQDYDRLAHTGARVAVAPGPVAEGEGWQPVGGRGYYLRVLP